MLLANKSHRDGSSVFVEDRTGKLFGVVIARVGRREHLGGKKWRGNDRQQVVFETDLGPASPGRLGIWASGKEAMQATLDKFQKEIEAAREAAKGKGK